MRVLFFKMEDCAVNQHTLSAKWLAEELLLELTQVPLPKPGVSPHSYRVENLLTRFQTKIYLLRGTIIESNFLGSRLITNE